MRKSDYGIDAKGQPQVERGSADAAPMPHAMQTWYLFLFIRGEEAPSIIRRCEADGKGIAAEVFARRLNRVAKSTAYSASELLSAMKEENKLSEMEREWVSGEDPQLLAF